MHWLRNLPVSRKFLYAFGLVCGLCIMLGTYTFIQFHSIAAKNSEVSEKDFPSVIQLATVRETIGTLRREDLPRRIPEAGRENSGFFQGRFRETS